MKGLLIKDFYCLKRQLFTFICCSAGVLVIAVFVSISLQCGNLADGFERMLADRDLTNREVQALIQYCMLCVLLIPMAFTGNIADVFLDDSQASFQKLAGALPVSISERVGARYLSGLSFTLIGFLMDVGIVFVLSGVTELVPFWDFFGVLVSFASFMVIYLALFILFEYLFGVNQTSLAQVLPIIIIGTVLILPHIREIADIFLGEAGGGLNIQAIPEFLMHRYYIPGAIALVLLIVSYGLSVWIAGRKRGVA